MSDKEIARKKNRLRRLAAKEGAKCFDSFYYFFKKFWPEMSGDKYIDAPHIEFICDTIQEKAMKVVRGEISMETLIINVPPGSSKSTIATIAFPMWIWLHAPHLASTNVSYSDTLSARHAKKARSITDSKKWKALFDDIFKIKHGKPLEIISQNKKAIENNFKGERFNTSVDGTITGMHADFIIKDDMQNPKEAKSDTIRESVNEWDEETLTSRHKNEMCYLDIIIAQRLHEEDLTGYTLNKDIQITQVCLPSQMTNASKVLPSSAESLYTDGILDPNRRPQFVLDALKAKSGSSAYTCQYLQAPFNLEEQDIQPSMFEIIESVRDDIVWDLWIDGAYTEKTENDPSGIDVIARVGNNIIVKESYNVYKKLPDLLAFIVELEKNDVFDKNKGRIFIEPKASGHSLADYIEFETDYNFVRIGEHSKQEKDLVKGGHKARHETIKPKAESHRIKLLKGTWNDDFIVQICGFPKAAHDEQVDNLGYAINHYYFRENTFIEEHALNRLEKNLTGSIPVELTSQITGYKIETSYEENDSGDIMLFDDPNRLYRYRYICVLALKGEGERGGNTSIVVLDRMGLTVPMMFVSNTISAKKAAKKAIEIAHTFETAKLVVTVQKEIGQTQNEEYDLSHIAIKEARAVRYDNIYSRLTQKKIKKKREREYGFVVDQSTSREIYYHLKDMAESAKIREMPLEIFNEVRLLERKKDTGEITAKEGYQTNAAMAYAVALKIDEEWQDKPKVKRSEKWN
jgi:phage terminase large subunit-like protein